jgi:prepilin-type N-terminal cleavage/methylation domain-containing protein
MSFTRNTSASQAARLNARRGFTLVELLVVITIIGILAGLISVAAVNAVTTAKQMRIKFEVDQLDAAMKDFKQRYGAYPPCNLTNVTSNQALKSFVARAFPRYNQGTNGAQLNTDLGTAGIDTSTFDPARALVFWLSGFNPDVTHPFTNPDGSVYTGTRTPIYGFDKTRLVLAATPATVAGPAIQPGAMWYLPQGGQTAPFVYFDNRAYTTDSSAAQPEKPWPYSNAAFGGVAQPYALDVNGDKALTTGTDAWANSDSFQIISAGLDGNFGASGSGTVPKLYPAGTGASPYTIEDFDNCSNFCDKASLEAAKP